MHGSAVPRMNHCTCVLSHANINRQNENQLISLVLMLEIFNVSKCKSMLISRKRKCPELTVCGQVFEQVESFTTHLRPDMI